MHKINLENKVKVLKNYLNKSEKILKEYHNAMRIIEDIKYLKLNAGNHIFTGKSGKVGENSFLREIKINDIGGCVEVPKLLLGLARNKLGKIIKEIEIENNRINVEEVNERIG